MMTATNLILSTSVAAFNLLVLLLQTAQEVGAGSTILFVGIALVLLVLAIVGLPFLMNYRKEVRPKEKGNDRQP